MFKKLLVIATLAAGLISTQASAGFVQTDLRELGDKKAVLHQETGLEWLSLDETRDWSLSEALAQTAKGGILEGWRLPSYAEVENLFITFFAGETINIYGGYQEIYYGSARPGSVYMAFRNLFAAPSTTLKVTLGWFYKENGDQAFAGVLAHSTYQNAQFHGFSSTAKHQKSVFLVSDGGTTLSSINDPTLNINNPNAPINMADVSAPPGLAAAGVLMLMLGARRKTA